MFAPRLRYQLGVDEMMLVTIRRARALHEWGLVGNDAWCGEPRQADFPAFIRTMGWVSAFDISLVSAIVDHQIAGNALLSHGSPAQVDACRAEINDFSQVYAFAATELAHGSNLRAIGTEVHYRHADRSLCLVTPTDHAAKYWIGNSLFSATYAMVLARLVVDGQDEGHHWFRVPLREREGALPCPGIRIRRADPKAGITSNQTGMIHFDRYRVPLDALMSGWAHIDSEGRYHSAVDPRNRYRMSLQTFIQERIFPTTGAAGVLRRAAAITLRYSRRREAFGMPLLGHQHYRERLLPVVSHALALHHLTEHLITECADRYTADPLLTHRRDLYGLTSGTKAYASWTTNADLTALREMCGGHGFHSYNEIGPLRTDIEINTTFAGDNTILSYENARVSAKSRTTDGPEPSAGATPAIGDDGLRCDGQAVDVLEALANRLLSQWVSSQQGGLCPLLAHAQSAAAALRRWSEHTTGSLDDALRRLYAVNTLLELTDRCVAAGLLDSAAIRGLLAQRAALSDQCAEHPDGVLDLLGVPEALLDVPIAHPDYVTRTVRLADETREMA
ncbi:acyl-CoA dehydrogenase family protein [Streptomyces aureocirculatus]|uniref:acyl-CoA dehydrogenase family protein n=1 Tax=Streptomyces aureocirculatus TaxID=67275 RepID=UPI0006902684|nr:acyl-CoA dehydrogenase family protein [Streptomyces aureocirculatus]